MNNKKTVFYTMSLLLAYVTPISLLGSQQLVLPHLYEQMADEQHPPRAENTYMQPYPKGWAYGWDEEIYAHTKDSAHSSPTSVHSYDSALPYSPLSPGKKSNTLVSVNPAETRYGVLYPAKKDNDRTTATTILTIGAFCAAQSRELGLRGSTSVKRLVFLPEPSSSSASGTDTHNDLHDYEYEDDLPSIPGSVTSQIPKNTIPSSGRVRQATLGNDEGIRTHITFSSVKSGGSVALGDSHANHVTMFFPPAEKNMESVTDRRPRKKGVWTSLKRMFRFNK